MQLRTQVQLPGNVIAACHTQQVCHAVYCIVSQRGKQVLLALLQKNALLPHVC
jgi:hypothetical protein